MLKLQVQEAEEREANQKRMYDRFFKALDEQGVATPLSNHTNLAKNTSN